MWVFIKKKPTERNISSSQPKKKMAISSWEQTIKHSIHVKACQEPWDLTSIASKKAPFYPIQFLTYYKTGRQEEENENGGNG
jgi:hypothetical protein